MRTFDILVKTLRESLIFMIVSLFFYIKSSFRVKSCFKGFGINTRLIKLFFTKRVFKNKDFSKYGQVKKIIKILLILAKIQLKWSLDVYILQYCLLSIRTNSKKDSNAFELKRIWIIIHSICNFTLTLPLNIFQNLCKKTPGIFYSPAE